MLTPLIDKGSLMPFGKFEGWHLATVPAEHLQWCLCNLKKLRPAYRDRIEAELKRRTEQKRKLKVTPAKPLRELPPHLQASVARRRYLEAHIQKAVLTYTPGSSSELNGQMPDHKGTQEPHST